VSVDEPWSLEVQDTPPPGYTWDPMKHKTNKEKHAVSFLQAASVFLDPYHLTVFDEDDDRRDQVPPVIRIISARKATAHEIKDYYNNHPSRPR
jgi:uncharacterized protein